MSAIRVIIPQAKLFALDYKVPHGVVTQIGQLVVVPLRQKQLVGIVIANNLPEAEIKLREMIGPLEPAVILATSMLKFLHKAAQHYVTELGSVAKLTLPINLAEVKQKSVIQEFGIINLPQLSKEQMEALEQLRKGSNVKLLRGLTGSGKTELYFYLAYEALKLKQQVLILLPEIALSQQIIQRFEERFGAKAIVWNSSVTPATKAKILWGIISGSVQIIIGTRSALFLPYTNLGLIIVDEEHDASYKQEDGVLYNARDMAVLRGSLEKVPVILGSATPSIETYQNALTGKYQLVELDSRFGPAILPKTYIIDMRKVVRQKDSWVSVEMRDAIKLALNRGEQALLFLNRKGYAPLIICSACGHHILCHSCSTSLVYHKAIAKLVCHHCGYQQQATNACPECKSCDSMVACGPGVERLYEEIAEYFPYAKLQIMTKDELSSKSKINAILDAIMNNQVDIIIGTQIITKGYHFPKLTMVGVIDTDLGLGGGDLRAAERTFQLLYQVGGRAGREAIQGHLYLQSYAPDSKLIMMLKQHDLLGFLAHELQTRISAHMPPFTRMAAIIFGGKREAYVKQAAQNFLYFAPKDSQVTLLGPSPAIIAKVKDNYRYRLLIIAEKKLDLGHYISYILTQFKPHSSVQIKIDIDPYNFY